MARPPTKSPHSESAPKTIAFDYIKSTAFRSIHVDGAMGALTPNGNVHMAFYSERPAIPRRIVHQIAAGGLLGDEVLSEREGRNSIVREMDVDVFLSIDVARSIHKWLEDRIEEHAQRYGKNEE